MIKKALKVIAKSALVLSILIAALFAYGRMRGATAEQEAALNLLVQKPVFKPEQNLAAYMWLLRYDVPEEKIESIFASDVKRFNSLEKAEDISTFLLQVQGRYPLINYYQTELQDYCNHKSIQNCLPMVERNQKEIRTILDTSQESIKRAEAIAKYRVYYSPMKMSMESPLPAMQDGQQLLRVYYADLFINGQQHEAMAKVCRDLKLGVLSALIPICLLLQ